MLMIDQENIRKAIRRYRDRWRTFRYWTVVEIVVMTAAGIGCVGLSANEDWHFYYEGTVEQTQTVTVPVETTEEEPEVFVTVTTEDPETVNEEEEEPEPSALRMNMAGYFPDGADGADAMNSYAGKAFTKLSEKDASWIKEIYGISKRTPAEVGASIGKNLDQANSTDYWKDVVTTFVDGDGTPISGYSNAKQTSPFNNIFLSTVGIFSKHTSTIFSGKHSYNFV